MNYDALSEYAGSFLLEAVGEAIHVGSGEEVPAYSTAVYVAVGVDGSVLYVGSVARPNDPTGLRARIDEHLRKHERSQGWDQIHVIPLLADTPLMEVRRIEGRVGAHLAPSMSQALPRLQRRRDRSSGL